MPSDDARAHAGSHADARAYAGTDGFEIVSAVLDGRLARTDAAELLRRPLAGTARLHLRHAEVVRLGELIEQAPSIERTRALTELTAVAAEPLGSEARGRVLGRGAARLLGLKAPETALALLDEARELLTGDVLLALEAAKFRLRALCDLDRRADFERDLPAFLAEAERLGSGVDLCTVLYDRALLAARAGDTVSALRSVREARRIRATVPAQDSDHVRSPASFALQHAMIARQGGRFEEALGALEDMRSLALAAGQQPAAAWALSELGITWDLLGDAGRAEELLAKAAAEAERIGRRAWADHWRHRTPDQPRYGDDEESASWHRASSIMLTDPARAADAVPLLRAAIATARAAHQPDLEADARNQLAAALQQCGRPEQAQLALRAAVATTRRSGDLLREVRYVTNLARHLLFEADTEDDVQDARKEIAAALELGERLRADAATVELGQNVAITLARAYDTAILIAAALYEVGLDAADATYAGLARRQPEALLEMGQRARAATMTEALRVGQVVEQHADAAPELVPAMLGLRAAEAAVQLAAARSGNLAPALSARDRSAARLTATAGSAGVSLAVSSEPVPAGELAAALRPGEVLVDLLTVPEGVVVTCLDPAGRSAVALVRWPEEDRRGMLLRLRRAYRERLGAHPDDLAETRQLLRSALADLDTALLAAVRDTVRQVSPAPPRRMLVSPENELFHLPYWRLSDRLDGCVVSVLPTPGALPLLRARRRDGRRPWISVGDPSGTLRHAALDLSPELGYRPCPPETGALLDTLPGAGRVHFACHGNFDEDNSHLSGLEVLPSPDPGSDPLDAPPGDGPGALGRFTVAQISGRLHLPHCALVVLSACTSGLPRLHPASEFTGLPGAFLMSGTRNVVASLWPASDAAAALLMRFFYAALDDGRPAVPDDGRSPTPGDGRSPTPGDGRSPAPDGGPAVPFGRGPSAALAAARRRLAGTSRAEAAELLGTDELPPFDPPFAETVYTDCFQHYGVD
ncbi:CHAT domain-containing protein [Streptomyces sp. NPDC008092]|uniref:CHAT domain-containing protein n=1 Tax=Streptomyces sp. NPDC008092 TaxID=3364808 RepID=UPI0036DFB483